MERKIALIAELDGETARMCSQTLVSAGFVVDYALDGADIIRKLESPVDYDLVLMDVEQRDLSGLSVFFKAAGIKPYMKERFLFMAKNTTSECRRVLFELGLKCLWSPLRPQDLLDCADAISMKRAGRGVFGNERKEPRFRLDYACIMASDEAITRDVRRGRTIDISPSGVRVAHGGWGQEAGSRLFLELVDGAERHFTPARVMWSSRKDEECETGLFLENVFTLDEVRMIIAPDEMPMAVLAQASGFEGYK